jgi:thiamine biosynthesis lipoprotein
MLNDRETDASATDTAAPFRRSFRSMGTMVHVITPTHADPSRVGPATERVLRIFEREDRRFSRFRPDSELSRVNAAAGRWIRVSRPFARLTRRSVAAAMETDGLFDPTVLPALRAAGYDRDYREVRARAGRNGRLDAADDAELRQIRRELRALVIDNAAPCGAWRSIDVDEDAVRLPDGAELDFGGIAKGWTVDRASLALSGLPWAIVDAGGDLRVVGSPPDAGLEIGVEDPWRPGEEWVRLRVSSGALATTSVRVRAWGPGLHHVIDPRTALPSLTPVVQATVWATTCTEAEVWSKAAVLAGVPTLERVPAMLVMDSGEVVTSIDEVGLAEEAFA